MTHRFTKSSQDASPEVPEGATTTTATEPERMAAPEETATAAPEGATAPAPGSTGQATAATPESTSQPAHNGDDSGPLLSGQDAVGFQERWEQIQTGFVDDPRKVVEEADELVASVMQRLAEGFSAERERLEGQWDSGEDVSTEDLRLALQRYRSFFRRLLTT
jgi:hypothetical protein